MDNFCEIEIKQPDLVVPKKFLGFKVGEKKIPQIKKQGLYFDLYAWFLLWKAYGWDFEALSKKGVDELSAAMLYTGAVSYEAQKEPVTFTRADVEKWMDEIPVSKMKEIGRVLTDSMKVLEDIKAGAGAVEKKK